MNSVPAGIDIGTGCPVSGGRVPLYGPEFNENPARVYERLREQGQLAQVELAPGVPATLVVGYEAALEVLRNPGDFPRDGRRWAATVPEDCPVLPVMSYRPNCLMTDGAEHARLRGVITESVARVDPNKVRAHVDATADMLINQFAHRGSADLLTEYAVALPLWVFTFLHGCPRDVGERMVTGMRDIVDMRDPEQANERLTTALLELIALKRREPAQDMASWMIEHPAQLTDEEILHQLFLMLGAGTEPEANLIANALRLLLSDYRFAGYVAGGSMRIEDALDEVLWTDPPVANLSASYPVQDVMVAGTRLPADQPVVISYAAANTDPGFGVEHRSGNRAHLAWGAGPHACPVQGQARMVASIAIEKLLDRLPDLSLAVPVEDLPWRESPFLRALSGLPVTFTPVRPVETAPPTAPLPVVPGEQKLVAPLPTAVRKRWVHTIIRWWRGQ
ncbi:cytochrome P450 [Allokutzneria sp. A3M-2-11 16]|uniref:cytochrome P450 n=1 Tax=Allokutzneria sp. A3M-2-11 16 TaxID=2962043 RepID=UPI0020B73FBB|nr:cytochrome P450 [Allokutzneria sp. A3M-2-11 16]MCP3800998.1 cytochrome P450 [Allokutzneria sp. A3M-2-11 16]